MPLDFEVSGAEFTEFTPGGSNDVDVNTLANVFGKRAACR
jgi:hypothetical protein